MTRPNARFGGVKTRIAESAPANKSPQRSAKRQVMRMGILGALLQHQIGHATQSQLGFGPGPMACFAGKIEVIDLDE